MMRLWGFEIIMLGWSVFEVGSWGFGANISYRVDRGALNEYELRRYNRTDPGCEQKEPR